METKKNDDQVADIGLLLDDMHRRAMERREVALLTDGLSGSMEWYRTFRRRERIGTGVYSLVAGLLAVGLALALLPDMEYSYMVGAAANTPQEVCSDIHTILTV